MWNQVEKAETLPIDAFHLLKVYREGDFGLFEHLLKTSEDIEYTLSLFIQFVSLLHEGLVVTAWVSDECEANIRIELSEKTSQNLQIALFVILYFERLARTQVKEGVLFRQVLIPEELESKREVLEKRLDCCVLSSKDDCLGFVVHLDQFKMEKTYAASQINLFLLAQAQTKITPVNGKYSFETKLYGLLREKLAKGDRVSLKGISQSMGMSSRTLQRKLSFKNIYFKDMVEIVRREIIETLMSRGDAELLQNRELLSKLGYQSPTSLYRLRERMMFEGNDDSWRGSS